MQRVHMWIDFHKGYDEHAIDALIEDNFPEADVMYGSNLAIFDGSAERSEELLRAINLVTKDYSVRRQNRD